MTHVVIQTSDVVFYAILTSKDSTPEEDEFVFQELHKLEFAGRAQIFPLIVASFIGESFIGRCVDLLRNQCC